MQGSWRPLLSKMRSKFASGQAKPVRARWTRRLGSACAAIAALVATVLVAGRASADPGLEHNPLEHKSISERVEAVRERADPEALERLGFDDSNRLLAQWYNWSDWPNVWDNFWSNWSNY